MLTRLDEVWEERDETSSTNLKTTCPIPYSALDSSDPILPTLDDHRFSSTKRVDRDPQVMHRSIGIAVHATVVDRLTPSQPV